MGPPSLSSFLFEIEPSKSFAVVANIASVIRNGAVRRSVGGLRGSDLAAQLNSVLCSPVLGAKRNHKNPMIEEKRTKE
jgi:hypothetical protein